MPMAVRTICEICLSDVDDREEGWGGILMMHKGVRGRCLVVVRAKGNIHLNVVDEEEEGGGGVEAIFAAVDIVLIAAAVVAVYSSPLPLWEG
jgi:hypothetical protein